MPKLILILLVLLLVASARRRKEPQQQPPPAEQTTVVEANHFYSQTKTSTALNIGQATIGKPLIFMLHPNNPDAPAPSEFNDITVTMASEKDKQTCTITAFYGLCVLPQLTGEKATLSMTCKKAPCELRWELMQPETVEVDGKHELNHLVSVNKDKNHAILKVFCSDPALKDKLKQDLKLYTNSHYEQVITTEGEILYLFNNEEKGSYFLFTKNEAVEKCAEVTLEHAEEQVQLKNQGYVIYDYLSNRESNDYLLKSQLNTDLAVQILAHHAALKPIENSTTVTVSLIGHKGKEVKPIQYLTLAIDDKKQYINFGAVFKKPEEKYESYQIQLKTNTQEYLITTVTFIAADTINVELEEQSYFDLKKGQKITYRILPLSKNITNIENMNIDISSAEEFQISRKSCPKEGCEFTVQALKDAQGSIYIGEDVNGKKATQIVIEEFNKAIGRKLREGEQKFYQYKLKKDTSAQFMVNTPSVIVYMASKQKCAPQKLSQCSERQFNYHHPTIYQAKEDTTLILKAVGLDNCHFIITALESNKPYIELEDSRPFVYLMDDNEHELLFHFEIKEKEDVSFNLVAGLGEMELFVFNQDNLKEDSVKQAEDAAYSMEGYVSYSKDDLQAKQFTIKVQKRQEYRKKYVHFTLIASTQEGNLQLQPGNAHYQTLKSYASRDYVFQVQQQKNMFINFFTQNLDKVDLRAILSRTDQYKNKDSTVQFSIDRQTDVINVATVSQKLCGEQLHDCELYLRLQNKMEVQADVTVTLMVRDVVVELKDGLWQTYDINEAASTAHFYFLPKHQQHSVTIFYHSGAVDLRLAYSLWKSDDTSIAMSKWPFPSNYEQATDDKKDEKQPVLKYPFKPTRFIHIEKAQMKECWPDCVILLSVLPDDKQLQNYEKKPSTFGNFYSNFKIMASNNLVEVPEKFKLDVVMNQDQEKFFLVDLKYFLNKDSLIFFTYQSMGSVSFKANLYTEKNPQCPNSQDFQADYHLFGIENELMMEELKRKLEDKGMESDKNPYLCILAKAYLESKFSMEFVSEASSIRDIPVDTTTAVKLKGDETRLFQVYANFKFYLKISRTTGFPFISTKICSPVKDMEKCLEEFKDSDEKGDQLVNKIISLKQEPCQGCIFFVKVTARQETQLSMHAQSSYAQIDLKQRQPLTDTLAANQINRYMITSNKNKEVIINIHILSGNIKVQVFDYGKVKVNKQNTRGDNNIQLIIPSKDLNSENKQNNGAPFQNAFALSSFTNLHLVIQSQQPENPANYIVTYSNGDQTSYLEDGLISEYTIPPKKQTKFLYNAVSYAEPIYLYLSTPDAITLNNIHPKIYGLENEGDETNRMELTPEHPAFKKKTVNPTMLLHFSGRNHYRIEIDNKNTKDVVLSVGINSRQIIYLPLEHEFPFKIDPKQYLYFVVGVPSAGYLTLGVNKCDASNPYIAYTDEYKQFVDEEFESEEQLSEELTYHNVIKIKKAGSVYLKIRASDLEGSMLTVKASFNQKKIQSNTAKAGDKGLLEYQLIESNRADLTFTAAVCQGKCNGSFTYSAVTSPKIELIYANLVCSSVSFDFNNSTRLEQPTIEPIKAMRSSNNKINFQHNLAHNTEYLGVKGVNNKTGAVVYYTPVELINFSGKVDKALTTASQGNTPYWLIGTLVFISFCCVLIAYRRYKNRRRDAGQYIPVGHHEY